MRIVAAALLLGACAGPPVPEPGVAYEVANGVWYTGSGFEAAKMYAVDEVLRSERPSRVDSLIDLQGGYVVPPFGEAHMHRPRSPHRTAEASAELLGDGVF